MSLTQHLGYGRYRLEDFLPGELFARCDGSLGIVCDPQPFFPATQHIQVRVDQGTSNLRMVMLHRTALACAVTEEQAWTIEHGRKEAFDGLTLLPE